jgi:NADPH:quinone reductase-like Zn-dependent oxidoreductase
VGSAAVQIASRFASDVVAVVRRPGQESYLKKLGATKVVVDTDGSFHRAEGGFDLVRDNVGSATFNASLRSLGVGGRLAVVGNITRERAELNLGYVIVNGLRILGPGGATRRDMAALLEEHDRKAFMAPIEAVLALSEADRAQSRLREGGLRGRLVLVPEP